MEPKDVESVVSYTASVPPGAKCEICGAPAEKATDVVAPVGSYAHREAKRKGLDFDIRGDRSVAIHHFYCQQCSP